MRPRSPAKRRRGSAISVAEVNEARRGYLFGVSAYVLWGLFPLYWNLTQPAGAPEVLAHRIVWSAVFTAALLLALRQLNRLRSLLQRPRQLAWIGVAAVLISANWGVYVYGVHIGRVVETSLGYFINPLIFVLCGMLVFGERLRRAQWAAVGIGAAAVIVLTVDYGRPPWIALTLAGTFALYGMVKKRQGLPAARGLFAESAVLALPALVFAVWLGAAGNATFGTLGIGHTLILASAGIATAAPLLFFAGAANRIPLTAIGMLQYIAPTMHFVIGVVVFAETMTAASWAGFALVWTALAIFSADAVRHARRGAAAAASTTGAVPDVASAVAGSGSSRE